MWGRTGAPDSTEMKGIFQLRNPWTAEGPWTEQAGWQGRGPEGVGGGRGGSSVITLSPGLACKGPGFAEPSLSAEGLTRGFMRLSPSPGVDAP